jgi:hypothetical protein
MPRVKEARQTESHSSEQRTLIQLTTSGSAESGYGVDRLWSDIAGMVDISDYVSGALGMAFQEPDNPVVATAVVGKARRPLTRYVATWPRRGPRSSSQLS